MYQIGKLVKKQLFIFVYGSLLFGCSMALVSSLLIELSYSMPEPQVFFENLYHRMFISLPVFMISGLFVGHWRWTFRP